MNTAVVYVCEKCKKVVQIPLVMFQQDWTGQCDTCHTVMTYVGDVNPNSPNREKQMKKIEEEVLKYGIKLQRRETKAVDILKSEVDMVNHPPHYTKGRKYEVIDVIDDWHLGFYEGTIVQYIARYKYKNGLLDLKKAQWYLNRLIVQMENNKTEEKQKGELI